MSIIYLIRQDPTKNQYRYYSLTVSKTLFGEWAVIRRWGRIGHQGGTVREQWYDSKADALAAIEKVVQQKKKRGYNTT